MGLQRAAGNRAVGHLIGKRDRAPGPVVVMLLGGPPKVAEAPTYTARTTRLVPLYRFSGSRRRKVTVGSESYAAVAGGSDVSLLDTHPDRPNLIEVSAPIVEVNTRTGKAGTSTQTASGWIDRGATNLAVGRPASTENDRFAQDLDDMLDADILPNIDRWLEGAAAQGRAYTLAYERFADTVKGAAADEQARLAWWAAGLTAVSAGSLGFLGDLVLAGRPVSAIMGSFEDAIQAAVGEGIDIGQAALTSSVSVPLLPSLYGSKLRSGLIGLRRDIRGHVGTTKAAIRRSAKRVDRATALVQIYRYWDMARASRPPTSTNEDEEAMAVELEKTFWQRYILEELTTQAEQLYGHKKGLGMRTFHHPEDSVQKKLDQLGISDQAGISEWDSWYQLTDTKGPRDRKDPSGKTYRTSGSPWTEKLHHWALGHRPRQFS